MMAITIISEPTVRLSADLQAQIVCCKDLEAHRFKLTRQDLECRLLASDHFHRQNYLVVHLLTRFKVVLLSSVT